MMLMKWWWWWWWWWWISAGRESTDDNWLYGSHWRHLHQSAISTHQPQSASTCRVRRFVYLFS